MSFLFGTSGIPACCPDKTSEGGVASVADLGLGAMELSFVHGVVMDELRAGRVRAVAAARGIALSVHAPYYINLNARDRGKVEASITRIVASAVRGAQAGADTVVFHPGFYLNDPPDRVYPRVRDALGVVREALEERGLSHITLCPETTGRPTQFGTLTEILTLCRDIPGVRPCVDFSHLCARSQGEDNHIDAFRRVLEDIGAALGQDALLSMHIHLSGIDYGTKGERRHVIAEESPMKWRDVLRALRGANAAGRIICESPEPENDALLFQKTWRRGTGRAAGGGA